MKSQRKEHPFIKVSCAALAESLLETELFGHEKGAFTGAVARRKGRFELADKGTLFLDEIGEISQTVQVKLLRVIQEREFERIGGTETISTDTRIISATNRDLAKEVQEGRFREDLFYRLNVIQIESPPLRSRREDIPLLAYHFLEKYKTETSKDIISISDSALSCLSTYEWPGNVRELQNVIERGVVLTKNKTLELADLPDQIRKNGEGEYHVPEDNDLNQAIVPLKQAKNAWEKRYIENGLKRFDGNVSRTAIAIGIARKNLQEKIKTYGISTADFKNP
jgi:two-component system response regulator AtoC